MTNASNAAAAPKLLTCPACGAACNRLEGDVETPFGNRRTVAQAVRIVACSACEFVAEERELLAAAGIDRRNVSTTRTQLEKF